MIYFLACQSCLPVMKILGLNKLTSLTVDYKFYYDADKGIKEEMWWKSIKLY